MYILTSNLTSGKDE